MYGYVRKYQTKKEIRIFFCERVLLKIQKKIKRSKTLLTFLFSIDSRSTSSQVGSFLQHVESGRAARRVRSRSTSRASQKKNTKKHLLLGIFLQHCVHDTIRRIGTDDVHGFVEAEEILVFFNFRVHLVFGWEVVVVDMLTSEWVKPFIGWQCLDGPNVFVDN